MDVVQEFLNNHMRDWQCDHCGRHFPKSALVGFDFPFKGFNGHYCVVCCHKLYDLMEVCSECGDDYPKTHLYKRVGERESYCKRCLEMMWDEREEYPE